MAEIDEARLALVKSYCKIDYDEDDALLESLMQTADAYLESIGCIREGHEPMFDVIVCAMVLNQYEGRCADNAAAALAMVPPLVRQAVTQLKLVCAFGGADDGN